MNPEVRHLKCIYINEFMIIGYIIMKGFKTKWKVKTPQIAKLINRGKKILTLNGKSMENRQESILV